MKYILLDLDGTITDPKEGITRSVQYALKSKGILIEDLDGLCRHIGPPLKTSFMDFYGFSESEAEELVKKYREYFRDTGIFENKVYEGMDELLRKLKAAGKRLITATSKPEVFAERILKHFELDHYLMISAGRPWITAVLIRRMLSDMPWRKTESGTYPR